MRTWQLASVCLLLAALMACSSLPVASPVTPTPTLIPSPAPTPARVGTSSPSSAGTNWELEYGREGGFAGWEDNLTINSRGECSLTRKQKVGVCVMPPTTLQEIPTTMDKVQFFALRSGNQPTPCCDRIQYNIRFGAGGKANTVKFHDGEIPKGLEEFVTIMDKIVSAGKIP